MRGLAGVAIAWLVAGVAVPRAAAETRRDPAFDVRYLIEWSEVAGPGPGVGLRASLLVAPAIRVGLGHDPFRIQYLRRSGASEVETALQVPDRLHFAVSPFVGGVHAGGWLDRLAAPGPGYRIGATAGIVAPWLTTARSTSARGVGVELALEAAAGWRIRGLGVLAHAAPSWIVGPVTRVGSGSGGHLPALQVGLSLSFLPGP
jgi:hypothetical protein